MHMTHGLVGTIKTSLNVVTMSASVKQQHHHSMFARLEQRSYNVQNYQTCHVSKVFIAYFNSWHLEVNRKLEHHLGMFMAMKIYAT